MDEMTKKEDPVWMNESNTLFKEIWQVSISDTLSSSSYILTLRRSQKAKHIKLTRAQ